MFPSCSSAGSLSSILINNNNNNNNNNNIIIIIIITVVIMRCPRWQALSRMRGVTKAGQAPSGSTNPKNHPREILCAGI